MTEPLLVYGDAYLDYDFGPEHPLTPRRFGPSIDADARDRGGANFVEPRVATDDELRAAAHASYIDTVQALRGRPGHHLPSAGIGPGDCPPFDGHARGLGDRRRRFDRCGRSDPRR